LLVILTQEDANIKNRNTYVIAKLTVCISGYICKGYLLPGLGRTFGEAVASYTKVTKENTRSRTEHFMLPLEQ
jgi:hypothetical protein